MEAPTSRDGAWKACGRSLVESEASRAGVRRGCREFLESLGPRSLLDCAYHMAHLQTITLGPRVFRALREKQRIDKALGKSFSLPWYQLERRM